MSDAPPPAGPVRAAAPAVPDPRVADPISAMAPRFNWFLRWFARRWFRHFDLDDATVARLRALEERGSVVYVMRYASRLDYFLLNTLLAREGLRLSAFANGIRFFYYRPFTEALRIFLSWRRSDPHRDPDRERVRALIQAGESMFLFLRTARLRNWLRGRRAAVEQGRQELDLLAETVREVWSEGRPVHVVPIALFWRKGPRSGRRFLNLTYGTPTRPSDLAKISSFLLAYRDLAIHMGDPIDLASFVSERRHEGQRSLVRKIRRSILLFLYREERAVEGPTLRPRHKVQEHVLAHPEVIAAVEARAGEEGVTPEAARLQAEKIFREIAAAMNSTFFAFFNAILTPMFRRMFVAIETTGIEKVAGYAKRHPVVLVPSHRSYFDFLILSWLFYHNYLVPPHIAARDNMKFGPFGWLFRRAGAFFLRGSFDDPLYKEVFRHYLSYLVKEGFTQEFFIEGGRSRTGKTLMPRLGMVAWNLEAFARSGRGDLFIVPIALTYERLVEEGAMVSELEGGKKSKESTLGLLRARKFLRRRFGSVHVNFGEPISLASFLGPRRALFAQEDDEHQEERRRIVEDLGNQVVERINWAMVANATSVAACAILGESHRGVFRSHLTRRMRDVTDLLRLQDVRMTPALMADDGEFSDAIASLLRDQVLFSSVDPRGEIIHFDESRLRALDVYRNVLLHFLFAPSVMARRLIRGATAAELRTDLGFWLDFFHSEFFAPRGLVLAAHFDAFLDYFERIGALERSGGGRLAVTEKGRSYFTFLGEQTRSLIESYYVTFAAVLDAEDGIPGKRLEQTAKEHFERTRLLGEVRRREAWNPVTHRNAVELLVQRGVLAVETEGRERRYRRGRAEGELSGLHERLAATLRGE